MWIDLGASLVKRFQRSAAKLNLATRLHRDVLRSLRTWTRNTHIMHAVDGEWLEIRVVNEKKICWNNKLALKLMLHRPSSRYLLKTNDVISFHYSVPAKSVCNPIEQVTDLLVVDRAQCLDLESKLLMLRANSVRYGCAWTMGESIYLPDKANWWNYTNFWCALCWPLFFFFWDSLAHESKVIDTHHIYLTPHLHTYTQAKSSLHSHSHECLEDMVSVGHSIRRQHAYTHVVLRVWRVALINHKFSLPLDVQENRVKLSMQKKLNILLSQPK
jgi:hypothetical protein